MKKISFILGIAIVASLLLGQKGLAQDQIRVMEPIKYDGPGHVPDEIIVKFNPGVGRSEIAKINSKHGTTEIYTSPFAGFKRMKIPKGASAQKMVNIYSKNPNVEYAELNYIVYALMVPNDSYYSYQWHMDNSAYGGINMEQAWNEANGAGVIVAVIDTGVAHYPTPAFDDLALTSFVDGYNFVSDNDDPTDDHGHGTHVTGTIAQSTNNALGVAGVAYACSIMPVKVLNSAGSGTSDAVADGIMFAADNGAQVINMSLGSSNYSETIENAVAYAYGEGVTIVCASGNNGSPTNVLYPAAYDAYCIAVGATTYNEQVASYSNGGSSLDLTAPGGNVYQDLNGDGYGDGVLQQTFNYGLWGYWFMQGTSMAAPHVSGVAALVISEGIASTPDDVRAVLESTAEDKGAPGWDSQYGHGIVNAAAAVGATGEPPVANDDSASTSEDTAVIINVLNNDTDADSVILTVNNLTQPSNGTAVLNEDQTVTYTPNSNFNSTDSFTYTANDGTANSNVATVTVTVTPINDAPVANDDSATTQEDTQVTIDVLANDTDVDGDALTVTILTPPSHGTASPNLDITVTYTPNQNYNGNDTFIYTIDDGNGGTDTATVTVTVQAFNNPPVANNDTANTMEDASITINVLANDIDALTVTNLSQPSNGTTTLNANQTVTYTPNADFYGTDSFTYTANDGTANSNVATVTVTVESVNDEPVANNDSATTDEDVSVTINVLDNDTDVDGDALTVTIIDQPDNGITILNSEQTVTYTPAEGFSGTDSFTYTANDGTFDSAPAIVTITVTPSAPPTMHVGDLEATKRVKGKSGRWQVFVTVRIHDEACNPVANATVTGTWSGAKNGSVFGTTGSDGTVILSTGNMKNGDSVTFTMNNVSHSSLTYEADDNHDFDGDSDGTSIEVSK